MAWQGIHSGLWQYWKPFSTHPPPVAIPGAEVQLGEVLSCSQLLQGWGDKCGGDMGTGPYTGWGPSSQWGLSLRPPTFLATKKKPSAAKDMEYYLVRQNQDQKTVQGWVISKHVSKAKQWSTTWAQAKHILKTEQYKSLGNGRTQGKLSYYFAVRLQLLLLWILTAACILDVALPSPPPFFPECQL